MFILVAIAVVVLWPASRLKRLAPAYHERSSRWESFARWTDDFPRLKDDPPATLELWKKVLIYGVAFCTAASQVAPESSGGGGGDFSGGGGGSWWADQAGEDKIS